jgi:putative heme iron utilization protein
MTDTAFDPLFAARTVLRSAPTGAIGTLSEAGTPFTSLVTVATAVDGSPLLLLSRLAVHTRNLDRDGRCSLLLVAPGGEGGDPLAGARLTVEGTAARIAPDTADCAHARGRFLARHPAAEGYAFFTDFGMFRIAVEKAHLVAGFGRIHTISGADLLAGPDLALAFADAEPSIVAHMNEDHADAVALYAARLLGQPEGAWKVVAADPDGLDLACGDRVARLPFRERQTAVMRVRGELKALSEAARSVG